MGKRFSVFKRISQNYNVQNRAHKVLDAEKPRPAPKHASETRQNDAKHGLDEFQKKDDRLVGHLKSVYVVSQESMTPVKAPPEAAWSGSRPLPSYRRIVDHPPLGYVEPERVSEGHVTLMQAMSFIMEHQSDPDKVTARVIADRHGLDEGLVVSVLKHFSAFELRVPQPEEEVTVVQRITQLPKMLVSKKSGEETDEKR